MFIEVMHIYNICIHTYTATESGVTLVSTAIFIMSNAQIVYLILLDSDSLKTTL